MLLILLRFLSKKYANINLNFESFIISIHNLIYNMDIRINGDCVQKECLVLLDLEEIALFNQSDVNLESFF